MLLQQQVPRYRRLVGQLNLYIPTVQITILWSLPSYTYHTNKHVLGTTVTYLQNKYHKNQHIGLAYRTGFKPLPPANISLLNTVPHLSTASALRSLTSVFRCSFPTTLTSTRGSISISAGARNFRSIFWSIFLYQTTFLSPPVKILFSMQVLNTIQTGFISIRHELAELQRFANSSC